MALHRTRFQSPFVSKKQSTMIHSREGYEQAWDWSWTAWATAAGRDGCRFGALFPLNNLSPDRDKQSLEEEAFKRLSGELGVFTLGYGAGPGPGRGSDFALTTSPCILCIDLGSI